MAAFGCVGALVFVPLMLAYNGVAVMVLWRWFVAEPFGLPEVSLAHALGIGLFSVVFQRYIPRDEDDWPKVLIHELVNPGIAMGIGYLLKHWWM